MPPKATSLVESIEAALAQPNPVLFAGAGVGRRVGLPDWYGYMEALAAECERFNDSLSAQLIKQRVSRGHFLEAATVYKTCDSIPEGERWKGLAAPFTRRYTEDELDRIVPLVSLGFTAIVTTNYDRSFHEACVRARLGWVTPVERGDDSLKGASFKQELFIARIHGRAEQPSRMIVDTQDYHSLETDDIYLDFILHLLRSRSCIFVGFSFVDPAINQILTLYKERFGPEYHALHTALIPSDASALASRLREVNIRTVLYDPAEGHVELWRAVRQVYDAHQQRQLNATAGSVVPQDMQSSSIHRYMAFAYAQIQSTSTTKPLVEMVQDGVVLATLSEAPDNISSEENLVTALSDALGISHSEAATVITESLSRLERRDQVIRHEDQIGLGDPAPNPLESHLDELARSVLDRMRVREQVKVSAVDHSAAVSILESVFMSRAWDVAAHYAGSASGWGTDLPAVVRQVVSAELKRRTLSAPGAMERAIHNLLVAPEDREAPMLAAVGRAAFGVQLILATPRQALFRKFSLPEKVYLDASVLMPAIVAGHPLQPVYVDSLRLLSDASDKAGIPLRVSVGVQFLNEIVSHREIAENLVEELQLEEPSKLKQHITFYGATNTNVFVAAYANHVSIAKKRTNFREFLRQVAPYRTEAELARYLRDQRIETEDMSFRDRNNHLFVEAYNRLYESYEQVSELRARKKKILIEHEGQQLAQLKLDQDRGLRSIFVTADNGFRRALQRNPKLHAFAGVTVSQIGLAALVDVMIGLDTDDRSLARLIWATQRSETEQSIFEYLVRVGIQNYQEGMALEMQEAAQAVASRAAQRADRDKVPLFGKTATEIARTTEFLDGFQDMFFRYWREAIERRERTDDQ
jgi:hypothetical protein